MSTKSTIMYFEDAHLYHEAFEDDAVYLELENVQFKASNNRVQLRIPVSAWESLRKGQSFNPYYIDKTDEVLLEEAINEIDKRLLDYHEALKEGNEKKAHIVAFIGTLTYGSIDLPREEQISNTFQARLKRREEERVISEQIKKNLEKFK